VRGQGTKAASLDCYSQQEELEMKYRNTRIAGVALALAFGVFGTGAVLAGSAQPQDFVQKASIAGMYEVRAAELARDKGQAEDVREFAGQMLEEHGKANEELQALARQRKWNVPTEIDARHSKLISQLSALDGLAFDREYAKQQLTAHQEAVSLFERQAEEGTDQDLKRWAGQKVATLKDHLEEAQELVEDRNDQANATK